LEGACSFSNVIFKDDISLNIAAIFSFLGFLKRYRISCSCTKEHVISAVFLFLYPFVSLQDYTKNKLLMMINVAKKANFNIWWESGLISLK